MTKGGREGGREGKGKEIDRRNQIWRICEIRRGEANMDLEGRRRGSQSESVQLQSTPQGGEMTRPGKGGERPKGDSEMRIGGNHRQTDRPLPVLSSPSYLLEMGTRFHTSTSPSLQPLSHPSPYLRQRRHAEGRKEVSAKWAATSERAGGTAPMRTRTPTPRTAAGRDGPPARPPTRPLGRPRTRRPPIDNSRSRTARRGRSARPSRNRIAVERCRLRDGERVEGVCLSD